MTTATHQQNGQHWGSANGSHGAQKPADVGTTVRSTCQTWLGRLAVFFYDPTDRGHTQMQTCSAQRLGDLDLAHGWIQSFQTLYDVADEVRKLVHRLAQL